MRARATGTALVGTILAFLPSLSSAATVAINPANQYQTIEGFGGFGLDLITTQSYLDKLIGDLGVTMIRTNTADAAQTVGDWAGFVNAVKTRATALGESVRWICSTWSPPAGMKLNNSVSGSDPATNKLRPANYGAYANVVKTFLDQMKSQTGIDYYGVSFQNEPAFTETYWSCVYTPTEYRDMIKVAGPIVHAAYPNIKVFGAEDMLASWGTMVGPSIADTVSRNQMGAMAVHGYSDGVHPQPGTNAANLWGRAYTNCHSVNKSLWMTETSGYDQNWSGAMQLAQMIYAALKFGKLSAWVYWTISAGGADAYHLMVGENATPLYYVSKNYYRYVRPGAVMIDGVSDDTTVFSLAFRHPTNNTLAIVLINVGAAATTATITGSSLPTFTRYLTSSTVNCVSQGTTGATNIPLPANSVTTLYGTNYSPPTAVAPQAQPSRVETARIGAAVKNSQYFTLAGARMPAASPAALPAGIVVRRSFFSDGAVATSRIRGGE
jgi:O-glycosyl hydrolase